MKKLLSVPFSASLRWLVILVFASAAPVGAQQLAATIDPSSCQIHFTLGATLHTVHGVFHLKSGQMQWDASTGKATGSIVIDATSGNTDNASRDKNMHSDVLESAKFPEITFTPSKVSGALPTTAASQIQIAGLIRLHGQDHAATLQLTVQPPSSGVYAVEAQITVPWKSWGLKDPSTFLLHVADTVTVDIQTKANIAQ